MLAALAGLSRTDQELLRLAAWEQLGIADIAYVMECSQPAARVRLHRARARLASALAGPGPVSVALIAEVKS